MITNLDQYELLWFLEGCARGSHLRQGIWQRAVDEFYDKLNANERLTIYMYAKRDLTEIFVPKNIGGTAYQNPGHKDFFNFLACFNPTNRYEVHMKGNVDGKDYDEWVNAYFYDGDYHVKFNLTCAREYITETKAVDDFDKCNFVECKWSKHCARLDVDSEDRIGLYKTSKCDWFINKGTEHGADFKHFRR